jgi:hypothetical protein
MNGEVLTKTGRLKRKFLPAIYFDSSVVIDYWMTEGLGEPPPEELTFLKEDSLEKYHKFVRDLLKTDVHLNKILEIRQRLVYGKAKVIAVISPLCFLELVEWHAESGFKQVVAEASNVIFIQKKSKKEIGDYLNKVIAMRQAEIKAQPEEEILPGVIVGRESTPLEMLMSQTVLNTSFAVCHGLQGLLEVEIANFKMSRYREPFIYAYLQVGTTDIIHILLAQHLGCKYFASFDSDFKRVKDFIKEENGMTLLSSPEEILEIL